MRTGEFNRPDSALTNSDKPNFPNFEGELVKDIAGRALLVVEPQPVVDERAVSTFRQAPFLAQLIATKDQHPQTRTRRRAAPADAICAYRAVEALTQFD
jgi:hypothetical protein